MHKNVSHSIGIVALLLALIIPMLGATCSRKMKKMPEYRRQLWTAEVDENLDRIYQALVYQWKHSKDKDNFQFPSAGPTPARVPCGTKPHPASATLWHSAGWKQLGFTIKKPFRYQYRILTSGKGKTAAFTIRAYGDLDCDGQYATYELMGGINAKGQVHDFGGKKFDEAKATE